MKFYDKLVIIDAKNNKATNLSIAAGALKLLSFLLALGAALLTLGILLVGLRPVASGSLPMVIWYLLEELDEALLACFFFWCATVLCGFASSVLRAKSRAMMSDAASACKAEAPSQISLPEGAGH